MKPTLIFVLLVGCSSSYAPPDLSGLSVNGDGLDGGVIDGNASIDGGGVAALTASNPALAFGTVLTSTASAALGVTISNQGDPSRISSVALNGSGASAFVITDDCFGTTLVGATTCAVKVRFVPTVDGVADATLEVKGNAGGVATITLEGTGVPAGALGVTPSAGVFGGVVAGKFEDVTLTLANVGTTPSGALAVNLSGPDAGVFLVVANNCVGGLAPSGSCDVTIRFSPNLAGARTATLGATDALGGSIAVALSGTGI